MVWKRNEVMKKKTAWILTNLGGFLVERAMGIELINHVLTL